MIANAAMITGCILMSAGIIAITGIVITKAFKPGAMDWAVIPSVAILTTGYTIANTAKLFAT